MTNVKQLFITILPSRQTIAILRFVVLRSCPYKLLQSSTCQVFTALGRYPAQLATDIPRISKVETASLDLQYLMAFRLGVYEN